MSRRLVVRSAAELDVVKAALWYESGRPGLGGEFLDAMDELLQRIAGTPLEFPEIGPVTRMNKWLKGRLLPTREDYPDLARLGLSEERIHELVVLDRMNALAHGVQRIISSLNSGPAST